MASTTLAYLKRNSHKAVSPQEIALESSVTWDEAKKDCVRLHLMGLVERKGNGLYKFNT